MPAYTLDDFAADMAQSLDDMEKGITRVQRLQLFADKVQGGHISNTIDKRKEVLDELEDECGRLQEGDFARMAWHPEEQREYDDYVCCTGCDRWYHFVCARYPAPEQCPRVAGAGSLAHMITSSTR